MTKFLSPTEQNILNDLFAYRIIKKWKREGNEISQKAKKVAIPIGVQELKIKKLVWKKAKNGVEMLHIMIGKAPEKIREADKKTQSREVIKDVSFDYINCYQLVSSVKKYPLSKMWFTSVGSNYTKEQLNMLFKVKNKPFKALVKHVEQEYQNHCFIRPEIRYVLKEGEEIDLDKIDYFKLYERIRK